MPGEKFGIVKFISRSLPLTRSDAITRSPLDEPHDLPFDTGGGGVSLFSVTRSAYGIFGECLVSERSAAAFGMPDSPREGDRKGCETLRFSIRPGHRRSKPSKNRSVTVAIFIIIHGSRHTFLEKPREFPPPSSSIPSCRVPPPSSLSFLSCSAGRLYLPDPTSLLDSLPGIKNKAARRPVADRYLSRKSASPSRWCSWFLVCTLYIQVVLRFHVRVRWTMVFRRRNGRSFFFSLLRRERYIIAANQPFFVSERIPYFYR